jgi:F0F1-type ATP synthase delta subunit
VKQTILAKRYAKAIFSIGQDKKTFEEYHEVLQGLAELFKSHPEVADALTNPGDNRQAGRVDQPDRPRDYRRDGGQGR